MVAVGNFGLQGKGTNAGDDFVVAAINVSVVAVVLIFGPGIGAGVKHIRSDRATIVDMAFHMHYLLQALDWLESLTFAVGAGVGFWAFRRCRKIGYLIVTVYFCLAVFSLIALPRIKAEWRARQAPTVTEETQRKISAAIKEAVERVMREEGAPPGAAERGIRFPLGPLLLVLGVWLLARREPRVSGSNGASGAPTHEHTRA